MAKIYYELIKKGLKDVYKRQAMMRITCILRLNDI